MFFRSQVYRKIDPELMGSMRSMSEEKVSIILYAHENNNCKTELHRLGYEVKYELPFIQAYAVEVHPGKLEDLASRHYVKYIAADLSVKAQMNIASQEIGATIAHSSGYTGSGVGIAIIDTGIFPHSDFTRPSNRIKTFVDFVGKEKAPYDDNGHGTFVAGVAAGSGSASGGRYRGIAPEADIISLKALDQDGGGSSSDILGAMQWVSDHHKDYNIRVLSMSLGSEVKSLSREDPMVRGVEALWNKGITVVVAAGNSGPDAQTITTPGISAKVITVGAADDKRTADIKDDSIADFSSRGPVGRRFKPDIVAPGVDIISVNNDANYASGTWVRPMAAAYTTMSGTSVSTPMVSGAAALLLQKNPDWTPDRIKAALTENAVVLTKEENSEGKGIISISKSLGL